MLTCSTFITLCMSYIQKLPCMRSGFNASVIVTMVLCSSPQSDDVMPEARHMNHIVRALTPDTLEAAKELIESMSCGIMGVGCRPDAETFNAMLEVSRNLCPVRAYPACAVEAIKHNKFSSCADITMSTQTDCKLSKSLSDRNLVTRLLTSQPDFSI